MRCYETCYKNAFNEIDYNMRQLREVQIEIVTLHTNYVNLLIAKRNIGESVSLLSPFAANLPALAVMLDEVQDNHYNKVS